MFKTKETQPAKKEATRRKVSVPYPEPGTERELLHNRRYVRENIGSFSERSWYVTATLPLLFTLAGSVAAIHNLTKYSDPFAAVGGWAGAEGVVAVFSYLAMLAMFRSEKVPVSYLVGIGLSTVAAVAVNVYVSISVAGRFDASAAVAALAPLATAASVSAVFKVIRSCLDDAARLEFFKLHQSEAADLLRTNQLARTPDVEEAQDETLKIVLSHTPSKKVTDLMTRQVEGLVGALGNSAPALEAPVLAEGVEEEVEAEVVPPLRMVDARQSVMHPSQDRRAVLPEEGAAGKSVITMKVPVEPSKELVITKAPTAVQRAKRELARIYWTAKLADRNLSDVNFRRRFLTDFSQDLPVWAVRVLNPEGEWERVGELRSSYLSRLKNPEEGGYAAEDFLNDIEGIEALVKTA